MLLATLLGMVVIVLAMMPVVDLFIVGGRSFFRLTLTNKQPSKWMDCVTVLPSVTLKLAALMIVASMCVSLEMSLVLLMVELRLFLLQNCPDLIPSHDRTNTACPNTTDPPPMPSPY